MTIISDASAAPFKYLKKKKIRKYTNFCSKYQLFFWKNLIAAFLFVRKFHKQDEFCLYQLHFNTLNFVCTTCILIFVKCTFKPEILLGKNSKTNQPINQ